MSYENVIEVTIPEKLWQDTGEEEDKGARLRCTFCINGRDHHVEAIAVKHREDIQVAVDSVFESNLHGMYDVGEPDKHFQTMTIKGREYVLSMTPYC